MYFEQKHHENPFGAEEVKLNKINKKIQEKRNKENNRSLEN